MKKINHIKKNYTRIKYQKLAVVSVLIGFLSAFLAVSLKHITEHYEDILFHKASANNFLLILFPAVGLSVIYFLRQYLFKKKENKGIKEIFDTTSERKNSLPVYKIPSHFINGLLTVAFGGSTGIEVSTVVASATVGSVAQEKENLFNRHKTELICAGVAAGVTALFCSPFAGFLFAWEVISKKLSKTLLITTSIAVATALVFIYVLDEKPLFSANITFWNWKAIPYFILLGIIAGMNSVYLTKSVIFFKKKFTGISKHSTRIVLGSGILGIALLVLPQLYGEGYHAIKENLAQSNQLTLSLSLFLTFSGIIILKPIVTSATLAAGGDGGVFAPSIFTGGFIGLLLAILLNTFFDAQVIPLNFMILGMGAMLSASINAPLTAIFLTCGLINNYVLLFPAAIVCLVAKYTAQYIYPHTVYSYKPQKSVNMPTPKIKRNYRKAKYVLYKETLVDFREHFWAFIGAFTGMGIIAYLQYNAFPKEDYVFLIGSFGASCVLIYGVIQSPLAQPRNLIGGHLISAIVGVTAAKLFPDIIWLASAVAVASAIVLMQITKTLHPPGGATALIAVTGSPAIVKLGYWYVLSPVLSGALILLAVALIFNNMTSNRHYPTNKKFTKFKNRIFDRIKSEGTN